MKQLTSVFQVFLIGLNHEFSIDIPADSMEYPIFDKSAE